MKDKPLKGKRIFFLLYLCFLFAGGLLLVLFPKGDIILWINKVSNRWFDFFFKWITHIGLGGFIAAFGVIFLFFRIRWSLHIFLSLGFVGIFTVILKRIFFYQLPRPLLYFPESTFYRQIPDGPENLLNTFPSGHTMAIFAFCCVLSILIDKQTWSVFMFFLALLVSLSRVYLLQHFFIDIYFGSLFGILSAFLSIIILEKKLFKNKSGLIDKGISSLIRH